MPKDAVRANERVALLVASLASFLTPFMGAATNVALPAIGREFGADATLLTWVSAAYLLAAAALLVPVGRIADLHGRKRIFVAGLAAYGLTSWLCAAAPSIGSLIGARVLQGAAGAMIFGTNVAILTSVFAPERRGSALGWNVAAVYLGLSLGPFLGGLLVDWYGWRSIFAVNIALGLGAFVATAGKLKGEWGGAEGARFDLAGSIVYGLSLVAMMYGTSRLPARGGVALVAAGLVLLTAFVWWELRTPSPLVDIAMFARNRVFAMGNLAALINYSATFAVGFLLSLYLQYVRQLTPSAAGTVLASQPIVMTLVSPLAGRLSDRVAPRILATAGMAAVAAGLFMLTATGPRTPMPAILAALAVLGCGFGLFSSPNTNAVMGSVRPPLYGVASATLATMRLTGQMMSMGAAMLLLTLFIGREPIGAANQASFVLAIRVAFAGFGVLCVLGAFASSLRPA
jgi:EmrB/QacA subfamily drug resistance transporter